jgi:membrane-associated phospholipid phosphatase
MRIFLNLYRQHRCLFIGFLAWLFLAGLCCCSVSKSQAFFLINSHHHALGDLLFTGFTFAGDGISILLLSAVLFFTRKKNLAITLFITYLVSGLISVLLKNLCDAGRPAAFFDETLIHHVSWLHLSRLHSFPSGHTTSAFAAAAAVAFHYRNTAVSLAALLVAALVAYSRVYLGQHFVEDVWMGSLLGFATTTAFVLAAAVKRSIAAAPLLGNA